MKSLSAAILIILGFLGPNPRVALAELSEYPQEEVALVEKVLSAMLMGSAGELKDSDLGPQITIRELTSGGLTPYLRDNGDLVEKVWLNRGAHKEAHWPDDSKSYELIGVNTILRFANGTQTLVVTSLLRQNNAPLKVVGALVKDYKVITDAQIFSLSGKSFFHFLFLAIMGIVLFVHIYTIVKIWKLKPSKRWLWILLSLLGWCQFTLIWATGKLMIYPLTIKSAIGGGYKGFEPLMFYFSIPVGALICWIKFRGFRTDSPPQSAPTLAETPSA